MATDTHFNAADWIKRFKAVGGGFMDTTDTLHFCWAIDGWSLSDNMMARLLYKEVIGDPVKLAAVRNHVEQSASPALASGKEIGR
ncbi:MAG TPA: hypothetical protein VF463_19105 [Sphingobium sp.]